MGVGLRPQPWVRERVEATEGGELERWADRLLLARSLDEVFAAVVSVEAAQDQ